jgi:hypothetical protein
VHHGDSLTALGLKNTPSGQLLVKCFRGCTKSEIHHEIDRLLQEGRFELSRPAQNLSASANDAGEHEQARWAARVWHFCQPAEESLVQKYLHGRGIALSPLPSTLRFHPNLTHKPSDRRWPAMVALVQDVVGQPRAVHRTWLSLDGSAKAPIEPNKMALGSVGGGAVRFDEATDTVVVAEGIETGLSVMTILNGQPTWVVLGTSGMTAVQLPPSIRTVTIAVDNDAPGIDAAQTLCRRLETEGRAVTMIKPNREGADFNDVVRGAAR